MAEEKKAPLSIVLRVVDKATSRLDALNKRLEGLTEPLKKMHKAADDLRENLGTLYRASGIGTLADGFGRVKSALSDLLGKVALIGGAVGLATHAMLGLVDEFDAIGDLAERIGVSVQFLSGLRFAAEKSGASVEQLDAGLQALTQNLGQARAGTGRMTAFLTNVSPALLEQLKAAKGTEQAFLLLSDAMAKIKDPAKRLALAQKTIGGAELAPLMAKGAAGVRELLGTFDGLAGSQESAAEGAGKVDDSLKDLKAASQGIKAALLTGLAPAMQIIVEKLTKWFVDHRADIATWAKQIGDELPAAVQRVVDWIGKAYDKAKAFFDQIGGVKTVLVAVGAITLAPLVTALGSVLVGVGHVAVAVSALATGGRAAALSLALGLGQVLVALAAITAGIYAATKAWEFMMASTGQRTGSASELLKEGRLDAVDQVVTKGSDEGFDGIDTVVHQASKRKPKPADVGPQARTVRDAVHDRNPFADDPQLRSAIINLGTGGAVQTKVTVDFANAPKGTRVTTDPRSTADVDLSVGYQMGGF